MQTRADINVDGLTSHDYPFGLGEEVETTEGRGHVLARSRLGYPEGIYLVQVGDDQHWMRAEQMAALEA